MNPSLRAIFQIKSTLIPPSDWNEEYNLTSHKTLDELFDEREDLSDDLALEMEKYYFKDLRNGFFIEAGASEGSILSRRIKHEHLFRRAGLSYSSI